MRLGWRALDTQTSASAGALLTVPGLREAGIAAAFTTKHGGVGADGGFNLGLRGDAAGPIVLENRTRLLEALGLPDDAWTIAEQAHGAGVVEVTERQRGAGARDHATAIPGADALVTSARETALVVLTADCVPILLADLSQVRVGVVHAGWRGAVAGVIPSAVRAFGPTSDTIAVIGPSIGPCCYEAGAEVLTPAVERFGDAVVRGSNLDLWEAASRDLRTAGVEQVLLSALCTRCEPERFFSHRAGATGRQAVIAALL